MIKRLAFQRVDVLSIDPNDPVRDRRIGQDRRHVWKPFYATNGEAFGYVYWRGEWYLSEACRNIATGKVFWEIVSDFPLDAEQVILHGLDNIRKVQS